MAVPQEVRIGSPFEGLPGGTINALVRGHRARRGQRQPSAQHNFVVTGLGPSLIIKIKNDSGQAVEKGHCLGINGSLIPYSGNPRQVYARPMVNCLAPLASEPNKFVIPLGRIEDGKIGDACLMGAEWARVDVLDVSHKFAKVKNLVTTHMETGASGAEIIYKEKQGESGSQALGVQWVLIKIGGGGGGTNVAIVRLTASLPSATDNAGVRTPSKTTSYENIKGTVNGEIEMWALLPNPLTSGTYLGIIEIDGDNVIWPAFC